MLKNAINVNNPDAKANENFLISLVEGHFVGNSNEGLFNSSNKTNDQLYSDIYSTIRNLFILSVSGSSIIFYIKPSIEYAGDNTPLKFLYTAGSLGANFALGVVTTQSVFEFYEQKIQKLKNDNKPIDCKFLTEVVGLTIVSAASALPFGVVYINKSSYSNYLHWLMASIIFIDNTIFHVFPLKVLLDKNIDFFSRSFDTIKEYKNINQFKMLLLEENLKINFIYRLISAKKSLLIEKNKIKDILEMKDGMLTLLEICKNASEEHIYKESTYLNWFYQQSSNVIIQTFTIFGGIVTTSSLIGYIASTLKEIEKLVQNNYVSWAITLLSASPIVYLAFYFGVEQFHQIYDSMVELLSGDYEKPLAIKLYPLTSMILLLMGIVLATFSFPTSAQLIEDNFSGIVKDILKYISISGTMIFSNYTIMLLINDKILEFARNHGGKEEKMLATFDYQINHLITDIKRMSDAEFYNHINLIEAENTKKILGDMSYADFKKITLFKQKPIISNQKEDSALLQNGSPRYYNSFN